jgi:hypothetical protein
VYISVLVADLQSICTFFDILIPPMKSDISDVDIEAQLALPSIVSDFRNLPVPSVPSINCIAYLDDAPVKELPYNAMLVPDPLAIPCIPILVDPVEPDPLPLVPIFVEVDPLPSPTTPILEPAHFRHLYHKLLYVLTNLCILQLPFVMTC